jgi:hypothetical protein
VRMAARPMSASLTSVWSRRPLPPPRTEDRALVHWDERRRFRPCHGVCKGGRPSAAGTRRTSAWRGSYAIR